nr:ribonuclease H-like domain-containing protein [Tanacetum cinerariifolium]
MSLKRYVCSIQFVDHAGRPRLSFVVDVNSSNLCSFLDACDNVAKIFMGSDSNSEWRPVVWRHVRSIFMDCATVSTRPTADGRLSIDANHEFVAIAGKHGINVMMVPRFSPDSNVAKIKEQIKSSPHTFMVYVRYGFLRGFFVTSLSMKANKIEVKFDKASMQETPAQPIDRLSLHTTSISPLPKSPFLSLQNPHWNNAMHDEYNALVKNGTWILVPRPAGINLARSMWLFKHKFHADGTLSHYKARLVANGSSQQLGIDCDESFSPVVKPTTIRTVLRLVVSCKWPIYQLDIKNAFLNGDLSETVYMHQPPRFMDPQYPHHVCLLQKSLYGLKQAPRAWFQRFTGLFLSQKQYGIELLTCAHMTNCNPSRTPIDTDSKLGPEDFGFHLYSSTTISLVGCTDADWAGCPSTRRFTLAETAWLRNLLRELHSPLSAATLFYCDNVSAT